jgi:hypothetical protein
MVSVECKLEGLRADREAIEKRIAHFQVAIIENKQFLERVNDDIRLLEEKRTVVCDG